MKKTNHLWVEKYRPHSFDEIVDQPMAVKLMRSFVETQHMPHIVLTGPPGTGKTSAAHILVRSMFPKEILGDRVLELNASEERGIRTVRGKIKRFVSFSIPVIKDVPRLSIVILDEADALTLDSQFALRRVMEDNCKNSRFILICNYINRIISPLLSRCSVIQFNALRKEAVHDIVNRICEQESLSDKVRNRFMDLEEGERDARYAINCLQKIVTGINTDCEDLVDWETVVQWDHVRLLAGVEDLLLDGLDIDSLIESFVKWATDHAVDPSFLDHAMNVCCHVANHGTPEIQLTSLVLAYKAAKQGA